MGVNLRPLIKETRTAQIQELGSLRFTIRERSAYRAMVTVQVLSVVGPRSQNFRLNPPRGFYGYATVFEGSAVREAIQLEFPRQRILDIVNPGIRDIVYEVDSERANLQVLVEFVQSAFDYTWDLVSAAAKWVLQGGGGGDTNEYINPPVAPTLPTVVKFVGSQKAQFEVTIDTWHFDNAASQITDPPIDPDDPTDGEDEYYEPNENDDSNPYAGNPPATPLDPGSDSRDNGITGVRTTNFNVTRIGNLSNCQESTSVQNRQWVGAGPPPYTITYGAPTTNNNCPSKPLFLGWRFEASDGSQSQLYETTVGIVSVSINNFTIFDDE